MTPILKILTVDCRVMVTLIGSEFPLLIKGDWSMSLNDQSANVELAELISKPGCRIIAFQGKEEVTEAYRILNEALNANREVCLIKEGKHFF